MALLGFTSTHINEKIVCDFYEDLLRNWLTHTSTTTKGDHAENTPLLPAISLAQSDTIEELDAGIPRH